MLKSCANLAVVFALWTAFTGPAAAGDPFGIADPAEAVRDFDETCRKGFPDLDGIEKAARAAGWEESRIRPVNGSVDIASDILPRAFHKNGALLFLTYPTSGPYRATCQVSAAGQAKASGADIAALVMPLLNAGAPSFETSRTKDVAIWTIAPTVTVEAGIDVYRKSKTISIVARQAR